LSEVIISEALALASVQDRAGGLVWNATAVGGPITGLERWMSLKIAVTRSAVALAATLGAGLLAANPAQARPDVVGFRGDYSPGTIVVKTGERRLYLILDQDHAVRYPVGVGKAGKQWAGTTRIDGKYRNPAWSPPAEVKRDKPSMPDVIPGGSPHNPMGVAAMTLAGGEYAIHGTNMPGSVGGFVSYGCIRMYNEDITDLYQRVSVGTSVVVTAR
jgi:lipoprotein-anchoring transpeptidase ErfK/SrfK